MDGLVVVLEDWLSDCDGVSDCRQIYECLQCDQERLIHAIYTLFDEKSRCPDLFESTVKQLFALARSKDERLREFVLLFAPSLLYIYLSSISFGDKKGVGSVEVALLALYNMEVLDEQGQPRIAPFRLPTLARQSVFHEPASLAPASFTVDSLQRLEAGDTDTVRWGPPTQMTSVTAATRHHLATAIMVAFNARLASLPKIALMHLCKAVSKMLCQGFNRPGHHHRSSYGSESSFGLYPRPTPRIPVTSELLKELLHAVYFAIHNAAKGEGTQCPATMPNCAGQCYHSPHVKLRRFNEFASLGIQALEDIHMRAQYELFADVLLMTNAIKNSLKVNPSGQPSDGPMGISVALTPSTTTTPLSKTFITNASFRTKKLPDDLLEYSDDEEDPFALERYVDISRDATLTQTQLATQGHVQSSGPSTPPVGPSFSRLPPQMGINALKMIPESKFLKNSDSRRTDDSCTRSSSTKQEGGSQSPKAHLLDLHIYRKHKRTPSGGPGANDHHSTKSGGSPGLSPRQNKEGSQSPKGIRLDLHLARKHKRAPSSSPATFDAQHSKPGDSPNLSSRSFNVKQEGENQSPKGNFLDLHLNRKHKRTPSGGQGGTEFSSKPGDSPSLSAELPVRDHSPSSERKLICFLKSHNPFITLQNLSPGASHRSRLHQSTAVDEEGSLNGSGTSSPPTYIDLKYLGLSRHSSDNGQKFSPKHHQSAPSTPSKVLHRHSADKRPRSIVVDGHMVEETFWNI
ncbi:hyccin isoform X2 [Cherax quadricarinatus]|uniref:hyccin isoform X2 n=1 Tax=Cherax quadricarinatus TaxID=27406 RepID=UPI00387EB0FF